MGMKDTSLILSDVEFCGWLGRAAPGDAIEYHRGFLALDCAPQTGRMSACEGAGLGHLARCALRAAEHGLVHLAQRRNGDSDFSYLAIARPRPGNPVSPATLIVRNQGEA